MKTLPELIKDAKERFKDDPQMMGVLEEMEVDVSNDSRIRGSLLTVLLCDDSTN